MPGSVSMPPRAVRGQPAEKRRDLRCAKLSGMPPAMEHNEAPDPMDIGVLGPPAVVPRPYRVPHPIEQLRARPGVGERNDLGAWRGSAMMECM